MSVRSQFGVAFFVLLSSVAGGGGVAGAQQVAEPQAAPSLDNVESTSPSPLRGGGAWLMPISRLRWGPFALYSTQISGGFSSLPLQSGSGLASLWQENMPAAGVGFLAVSTGMGASRLTPHSSFLFSYTPSIYRQTSNNITQVVHSGAIGYQRAMGRSWQLGLHLSGLDTNQYSFLLQPQPTETIARLRAPFSNLDLLDLIDQPQVLNIPPPEYVVSGRRVVRGSGGISLSRRLGAHNRLSFSGDYQIIRNLAPETEQALQLSQSRLNARSLSLGFSHSLSPRKEIALTVGEQRSYQGSARSIRQRRATLSYSCALGRNWSLHALGGPAVGNYQTGRQRWGATATGRLSRSFTSSLVSINYNRNMYFGEIGGGYQSDSVTLSWARTARPHARLIYSVSTGYQRLSSPLSGLGVQGWTVRPTLAIPLNRSMQLFSQYVFFDQRYGQAMAASQLQEMRRHLAIVGLRWDFQADRRVQP